ncbi:OmpA family protein, partial [Oleiphilus sp. HI0132]
YNKALSQRRADSVSKVLTDKFGLPAARVKSVGFGEEQPIADNATSEGRAANRRVVAVVESSIKKAATK